ncbi:MAG TPA: ATP-binding protein [Blastocatellia bacterium]|nr:ATP-binding protein [Blastocatellia bacterium]
MGDSNRNPRTPGAAHGRGGAPSATVRGDDAPPRSEPAGLIIEAILDGMLEGIVAIDSNTEVILYNAAAARIFDLPVKLAHQRPRLIEVSRDPDVNEVFREVLTTGEAAQRRVELLRRDRRVFALHVNPIGTSAVDGTNAGAAGIFFDITELERLERVRRDFFANLSHELRTPLTAILAYIETLLDGAIEDPLNNVRFLQIIQKHALRMQNLVRDITDLSMIESGEIALRITMLELSPIVDEMFVLASTRAEAAGVALVNRVPRGLSVFADRYRLEQILNNLIDNAIKFNVKGGRVEVSAEVRTDGASVVRVADTGVGIPHADLPRVFERFYRADRSRSRDAGGSGLGLAIVKHLARAHGGTVSVESHQARGSVFTIALPQRITADVSSV